MLAYPATPEAAASGYLPPQEVTPIITYFQTQGTPLAGLMTWSIGWDAGTNWSFAAAMATANQR